MKKEFLECGRICSAHGVFGAFKFEHWCDSASVVMKMTSLYFQRDGGYEEHKVQSVSKFGEFLIITLQGISDRESAQALKNTVLFAKREDIPVPEGKILIADMIGLPVIDAETGRVYGELIDVSDGVASQLYTIKTSHGDVLFPAVPQFLEEIDSEKGVFIRPIPGFFEPDEV